LSLEFPSSIGVGQGSALSPILLALCLAPLLKEFEHRVCMTVLISYIDNGTIIVQADTWGKNLVKLKSAYKIVFELTLSTSPKNTVTVTLTLTLAMPPTPGLPPFTQAPLGNTWASSSIVLSHSGSTSNVTQTRPSR
jgi:hypothetical protein